MRTTVFKLLKLYIMLLMVVWVAAIVSAMMSAGLMAGRRIGLRRMKGLMHERMRQAHEKACGEMEREEP